MQEISLASQDTQIDSKVVILTVDYRNEAVFTLLGDVQHSW